MAGDLRAVRGLVARERGLAVVTTLRADGSMQASVVNAGVVAHPLTGEQVVGFVAVGGTLKLRHLRRRPHATVVLRVGGAWASVEGSVSLLGPDDAVDGFEPPALPPLLREVFLSTGATHDDWPAFDRVMAEERRCVVLVHPERVYGSGVSAPIAMVALDRGTSPSCSSSAT
jgi:PPOX class probable F420-dependent enzyme